MSDQPAVFSKVESSADFPAIEQRMLALWQELDAFHESNRTIKDIVPRYWNMRGHPVQRRFGWDCHGLPIEALAQEALGLSGAGAIIETGHRRLQRAVPLDGADLRRRMAQDRHPHGPLGRFRQRLQDHGRVTSWSRCGGSSSSSGTRAGSTRATASCRTAGS